jgi:hypothetical protein
MESAMRMKYSPNSLLRKDVRGDMMSSQFPTRIHPYRANIRVNAFVISLAVFFAAAPMLSGPSSDATFVPPEEAVA